MFAEGPCKNETPSFPTDCVDPCDDEFTTTAVDYVGRPALVLWTHLQKKRIREKTPDQAQAM